MDIKSKFVASADLGRNLSFNDIADVAQKSHGSGHLRGKVDGDGLKVYGHRSGLGALFHKASPSRQMLGTHIVMQSVTKYVENKSPQTQKLAEQFIAKYANSDQRITNKEIVDLKDALDKIENNTEKLNKNLISKMETTESHVDLISDNLVYLRNMAKEGMKVGVKTVQQQAWPTLPSPELGAGMLLAAIDKFAKSEDPKKVLKVLQDNIEVIGKFGKVGENFGSQMLNAIQDFKRDNDKEQLIGRLCDLGKQHFFATERYDESEIPTARKLKTPNDLTAPMFVSDPEARLRLTDFSDASPLDRLQKLKDAYEIHMKTPGEGYEVESMEGLDKYQVEGLANRSSLLTPSDSLRLGLTAYLDYCSRVHN